MVVAVNIWRIHASDQYAPLSKTFLMGEELLPRAADTAATLGKRKFIRACFLGTGSLQAVAQESALKVMELNAAKVATLSESPLGLRHGPMSFLNKQTLVVAYLSGKDHRLQYELDLLEEVRSKDLCREILVVAPRPAHRIRKLTQYALTLNAPSDFPDLCRAPVDVIVGQLLALFFSIENGITPDTPSDGAISRVVSHVRIYQPSRNGNK